MTQEPEKILTRIYIKPDGNVIVTDLWEEIYDLLDSIQDSIGEGQSCEMGKNI